MRTYTARIQWLEHGKRGYLRRSASVRNIRAPDILAARTQAMTKYLHHMCASVSCIWYDWPQGAP